MANRRRSVFRGSSPPMPYLASRDILRRESYNNRDLRVRVRVPVAAQEEQETVTPTAPPLDEGGHSGSRDAQARKLLTSTNLDVPYPITL